MLKKFEIVSVVRVTEADGSISYYHDELFIGGYDKDGRFYSAGPANKTEPVARADDGGHHSGVVRPLSPAKFRRQQEHEAEKEITNLQSRLKNAKGET